MINDGYRQKMTDFLREYLVIPADCYPATGILPDGFISIGLQALILNEVFDNARDLQAQAFEDYGILIPDSMMKLE